MKHRTPDIFYHVYWNKAKKWKNCYANWWRLMRDNSLSKWQIAKLQVLDQKVSNFKVPTKVKRNCKTTMDDILYKLYGRY
jgi:hypothetical protein